ncbi:MAG TPA: cation diffusion facilitator family transporter [Candidatus Sulfotelmatobacter sp.]|nr:cation diffusion facilitator family transporter [Candidatus Sulfotelmatobacter sp.]
MKSNALAQGGKVAKKSFATQLLVGFAEVFMGIFTLSVALIADGIQSFADAGVSLIVWIGLRISRRAPDGKFHFGYYRVETFSSIIAAFFMATLGGIVLYESYLELLNPTAIANAELAMIIALLATAVSSGLLFYKNRAAKRYASMALKTDASNSIKDVLTSITAFIGITLSRYFNIVQADAIAGIVISFFVFTMVYSIIKEASLVLMDACQCPEILTDIEDIARSVKHVKQVHSLRMRKLGPYLIGDIHVVVDADLTVRDSGKIAYEIEERLKKEFDTVIEIKVLIDPDEPIPN